MICLLKTMFFSFFLCLKARQYMANLKKKNLYFFHNVFNLLKYQNFIYYQIYMPIKNKNGKQTFNRFVPFVAYFANTKSIFHLFQKAGGSI